MAPSDKTRSSAGLRHNAEAAAAGLPPLLVAAERVASTVDQGVHGRRRVGLGETFWQFRSYESGDSMRSIDWRQSAKSDRLFVRETEWTAAQSVWLWRDYSPSMDYRSGRDLPTKRERAEILLLALASLLVRAGERITLLGAGRRPESGKTALDSLAMQIVSGTESDQEKRGVPRFEPLPRYSYLVLFGDFLGPLEQTNQIVRRYAARGVGGHLVQVLDPAEATLPFAGRTRFEGMEDEGNLLIKRVENIRGDYKQRMEQHQQGLSGLARSTGWRFMAHRTDVAPERALLSLFIHLSETVL